MIYDDLPSTGILSFLVIMNILWSSALTIPQASLCSCCGNVIYTGRPSYWCNNSNDILFSDRDFSDIKADVSSSSSVFPRMYSAVTPNISAMQLAVAAVGVLRPVSHADISGTVYGFSRFIFCDITVANCCCV